MRQRGSVRLRYLMCTLLLVEGFARTVFLVPALSERVSVPDQFGWRRRWVARHSGRAGPNQYSFDRYDSATGWRTRSNIRNLRVFGGKELNTNADGFRGTRDFSVKKDTAKTRILLLGDSFTFGEDVSDDETYAHHLEQLLPNVEVLNLGVHGYGHDQMLALLTDVGVRYKPDVVLLGFVAADMSRNTLRFRDYAKSWYTLNGDSLVRRGTPVATPEEILRWDWVRPRTIDLGSAIWERIQSARSRRAAQEAITSALLANIIGVTLSVGAQPLIVYLPDNSELADTVSVPQMEQWLHVECLRLQQTPCSSVRPYMQAHRAQATSTAVRGHWNAEEHRAAAGAIAALLVSAALVHH